MKPTGIALAETDIAMNGERTCLYTAIYAGTEMILDVALLGRHTTDPAAVFVSRLTEKHDLSDAHFSSISSDIELQPPAQVWTVDSTIPTDTSLKVGSDPHSPSRPLPEFVGGYRGKRATEN
ncbi:DDE-type integrase/transposase/recombinase [Natronorarus salvus]|uniref:DDE-type integrase/transposase/recombinase n=1 Tax=Natronorarus salvus TaxID=3117733 RepID=UPI002F263426